MWLFAIFIAVPMIEIALFIQVGGFIGLGWTLMIVLVTALLGTALVRSQGALALNEVRSSFNDMRDPTEALVHGAMILFAGALLLTPGFFTDAVGFALLLPPVRRAAFRFLRDRIEVRHFNQAEQQRRPNPQSHPRGDGDVIDGDFQEVEIKEPDPNRRPSGWTRH
ncbi:FxsA family protein [Maribius pontilimi]|uniref:FxsA family protein n=1 Tax=Palleronia pontilimi TaxID=1964209 RepID=A0A934MBB5_9RHOB|nr:FxsA family protein [Palleronia pontilimi]MBJ3761538.1 FxsA family protein [Palleronia pontilimi]